MAKKAIPINGISWISKQADAEFTALAADTLNKTCPRSVLHVPIKARDRCANNDPIREAWDAKHAPGLIPRPIPTFSEIMNQHKKITVSG